MKPSEVKQEYQLQTWGGMIQEQKASGLSIKSWCMEHGVSENTYYYRLRRLRSRCLQKCLWLRQKILLLRSGSL